jgi:DNA repair photolyase
MARDLFEPILAWKSKSGSFRVLSLDAEQGLCISLQQGQDVILVEFEERNSARDCYKTTKLFNVCARKPFDKEPLNDDNRKLVDLVVDTVASRESRLPVFERPTTGRRRIVREVEVDQILIPEGNGQYYINPYVGCMIGCPFCYVADRADLSRKLEGLPSLPWGYYVDVKINAEKILTEEVKKYAPGIVRLSPILCDPYQPLERKYRITRQCLEILESAGFSVVILTRASLITEDIDILKRLKKVIVGFSIPTDSDKIRQLFEPGADPIFQRIEALNTLKQNNLMTMVFIQPLLPSNLEKLVNMIAPVTDIVRIDRMYSNPSIDSIYQEHKLQDCLTPEYFDTNIQKLRQAFDAYGIKVDDLDDLHKILAET